MNLGEGSVERVSGVDTHTCRRGYNKSVRPPGDHAHCCARRTGVAVHGRLVINKSGMTPSRRSALAVPGGRPSDRPLEPQGYRRGNDSASNYHISTCSCSVSVCLVTLTGTTCKRLSSYSDELQSTQAPPYQKVWMVRFKMWSNNLTAHAECKHI